MKKLLALSILVATSATLHAESLEEKKYWKGQMDYINKAVADGEKACDVKFSFELVSREKLRDELGKTNHSPNGTCNEIIKEVTRLCRAGADEKAAVKAKIKGFQCGYGKPRALELKSGIVSYLGNGEEANFSQWAKPWLMKHL